MPRAAVRITVRTFGRYGTLGKRGRNKDFRKTRRMKMPWKEEKREKEEIPKKKETRGKTRWRKDKEKRAM